MLLLGLLGEVLAVIEVLLDIGGCDVFDHHVTKCRIQMNRELVFVVLGGIGNIRGSMIAAILLTLIPELFRFLNDYRMLLYAVVLIVMMLFNWAPAAITWREKYIGSLFKKNKKEA